MIDNETKKFRLTIDVSICIEKEVKCTDDRVLEEHLEALQKSISESDGVLFDMLKLHLPGYLSGGLDADEILKDIDTMDEEEIITGAVKRLEEPARKYLLEFIENNRKTWYDVLWPIFNRFSTLRFSNGRLMEVNEVVK